MRIRWTKAATSDLTKIGDYLETHEGPFLARRVTQTICNSVQDLASFPQMGRLGRIPETRELIIQRFPYLVVYQRRDKVIWIVRLLHTSKKFP